MKRSTLLIVIIGTWVLAACTPGVVTFPTITTGKATGMVGTVSSGGGSAGTALPIDTLQPPTTIPTMRSGFSITVLKYRLLDQYPDFFFCDPDIYPVARADETDLARQRFAELQTDSETFHAILAHNGLSGQTSFSDVQKVFIYRDFKKLAAIQLSVAGDQYQFQLRTADQNKQGFSIQGLIDGRGNITVQSKTPTFATCPICLAYHTSIETPNGAVFVEVLKNGDMVWTQNRTGERVPAPVVMVRSVQVPAGHIMVHLILKDGRELFASPGHPSADGRRLGELKVGDVLNGGQVAFMERVPYDQPATYDMLPAGETGFYWANGILVGSTLKTP